MTSILSPRPRLIGIVFAFLALSAAATHATPLYWDANSTTAGAGSTPTGTWGTSNFLNTDSAGGNGTFSTTSAGTDDLYFVAGPDPTSGNGAYTVTLSGTQSARSLTFQSSGAQIISGGTAINLGSGGLVGSQFAFGSTVRAAVTINSAVALQADQIWANSATAAITVGGAVSGTNNIEFQNAAASTIILSGTNTSYSGATTLTSGILQGLNTGATNVLRSFGTGAITLNDGTLQLRANGSGNSQAIAVGNNVTVGFSPVTIDANRNSANTGSTFEFGNLVVNGGQVNVTGGNTYAVKFNGTTLLNGSTTFSPSTANLTLAGVVSDGGVGYSITKSGSGNLFLTAANTYTGNTTITAGVLFANNLAAGGSASSIGMSTNSAFNLVLNGGNLGYNGTTAVTPDRNFTLNTGGGGFSASGTNAAATLTINTAMTLAGTGTRNLTLSGSNTGDNTFATQIVNQGANATGLRKLEGGTWILTGANTYTGGTTLGSYQGTPAIGGNGGTLKVTGSGTIGTGTLTIFGGTFDMTGTTQTFSGGTFSLSMGEQGAVPQDAVNSNLIIGAGGVLNLAGNLDFRNDWSTNDGFITGGTLVLKGGNRNFTVENRTLTISSVIADDGTARSITKLNGAAAGNGGTLLLTGANTYTGATTVTAGTLRIGVADDRLPTGTVLTVSGGNTVPLRGSFDLNGFNQTVGGLSGGSGTVQGLILNGGAGTGTNTLTVGGAGASTFSGMIRDGTTAKVAITKSNAGSLTLTGPNAYYGTNTVSGGALIAGASSVETTVASNASVTANATTDIITLAGNTLVNGDSVIFTGGTAPAGLTGNVRYFVINVSGNTFQVSTTSGGSAVNFTDAGTTVGITQSGGAFGSGTSAIVLGDAATTTNNSSASLLTGGAFTIGRAVTVANQATSGSYTVGGNTANTSAFSGLITANQNLNVSQITGGTLNVTGGITGASAGTKTVNFTNVGAVNVNTTGISDGATGNIAVTKSGSGTTTVAAAGSYTGGTTISGGTLAMTHNSALGTGTVLISSAGTLNTAGATSIANNINLGLTAGSGGLLTNAGGGALAFGGAIRNNGSINSGGQAITFNGVLSGTGTLTGGGSFTAAGGVSPGNSPGTTTVSGTTLNLAATTVWEVAALTGTAGTDWDHFTLVSSGVLNAGGILDISFYGGLAFDGSQAIWQASHSFDLVTLTSGTLGGNFSSLTNNVYSDGFGTGTFTYNAGTGVIDYSFTAVPEPSTYALLGLGLGALWYLRRKKSRV